MKTILAVFGGICLTVAVIIVAFYYVIESTGALR
jgi:hypothetical protein